jgi:glucose-1-phosphate cytidylyltransferase
MKVVILSGGLGYRLKEETEFKPKPMVNIGNKPMLWHIMKIYAHYGFNEFIIALGYRGDYIKDYFLKQKYFMNNFTLQTKTGTAKIHKHGNEKIIDDFKITFVDTGEETLPGERILRIKEFIPQEDDDFMVTYGDGVSDVNIRELISFHKKQKTIGTITSVHPSSRYGLLSVDKNNVVKKFIEKPILKDWINGGFMIFKKDIFKYINPGEMEHKALVRLANEKQLSLFMHDGFWHSMDTYTDVKALNELWESDPKWKIWKS